MRDATERARKIVGDRRGVCLVPLPDSKYGMTSHERTFCDCTVEEILADAIMAAELRGRIAGLREAALITHETCAWTAKKNITDIADLLEKEST